MAGLHAFPREHAPRLAERFVPISIAEQTADDFDRFKRRGGSAALRTHIRTSTWHIPISWFVPFDGNERWLVLSGDQGPAGPTAGEPPPRTRRP
nr:hypothetical protein GCM10020093_067780 [Planobispora longispora]